MSRGALAASLLAWALGACSATTSSSNGGDGGPQSGSGSSGGSSSSGSSSGSSGSTGGSSGGGSSSGGSSSSGSSSGSTDSSAGGSSSSGGSGSSGLAVCPAGADISAGCDFTVDDSANCGGCGIACASGQVCSFGICRTELPVEELCGGSSADGGNACPGGTRFCPVGSCVCANLSIDPVNCGACGTVCGQGQICSAGSCAPACPAGQVEDLGYLSYGNPTCVPTADASAQVALGPFTVTNTICPATGSAAAYLATLDVDPNNCGSCGHVCPGQQCLGGNCVSPCGAPTACHSPTSNLPDGGAVCAAGLAACPTSLCGCSDLQTDAENCGVCGNVCGSTVCEGGQCVSGCPAGQVCAFFAPGEGFCAPGCPKYLGLQMAACGASAAYCALTADDPDNCGGCGTRCPSGEACAAGSCAAQCLSYGLCGSGADATACGFGQSCVDGGCAAACAAGQSCSVVFDACTTTCG